MKKLTLSILLAFAVLGFSQTEKSKTGPLRFQITLAEDIAPDGASGRLFVFLADISENRSILRTGFLPSNTFLAAREIEYWAPGESIDFDPDVCAYPKPFSRMKPGSYRFMALLDRDHSLAYKGEDGDDLYGPVVAVKNLNPSETSPVALTVDRQMRPDPHFRDTENIRLAEFQSPSLTAFWGRPIMMRAGVVLPPGAEKKSGALFPTVYHVHGFGGNYTEAWMEGPDLIDNMTRGKRFKMIHVFLNGAFPTGHHEFADSINNGPWGGALTREFIPWLEKQYPMIASSSARFLTGHSSGGWSTLWLQVKYPDFFNGTWSTAPDPVDFRSFTGVDVTPGSKENVYYLPDGTARNLVRMNGKNIASIRSFVEQEDVQGEYGGQFSSFEWVFSPRGQDGRPMHLFNRVTGVVDQDVACAWQAYDIHTVLDQNWNVLGPKLRGKIHVLCGENDTFHLEEATGLLCSFLKGKGSDAVCELIPGRDHFDLYESYKTYPEGLAVQIDREMQKRFEGK
jgi:pimeloyl-ACP methyl ester carboxylesterase